MGILLHSKLKEGSFQVAGVENGKDWLIYDVGGSRGQRGELAQYVSVMELTLSLAVWAPFIDDVDVVIFMAPISVFNQTLAEDATVNRLVCLFFYHLREIIDATTDSTIVSTYGRRSALINCSLMHNLSYSLTKAIS